MSLTNCYGSNCWYENNPDRIGEFKGCYKVVANKLIEDDRSLDGDLIRGEEIRLCDMCLNSVDATVGKCKICGRHMLGLGIFGSKDLCFDCTDMSHACEMLADADGFYDAVYDCLVSQNTIISEETVGGEEVVARFGGRAVSSWDRSDIVQFAKDLGFYLDPSSSDYHKWAEVLDRDILWNREFKKRIKSFLTYFAEKAFVRALELNAKRKKVKNDRKRKRDEANCEQISKFVPSIDAAAYERIKERLGLKSALKDNETAEDLIVDLASKARIENQKKRLLAI